MLAVTYNLYLQLGVDGLRGLRNFNTDNSVKSPCTLCFQNWLLMLRECRNGDKHIAGYALSNY